MKNRLLALLTVAMLALVLFPATAHADTEAPKGTEQVTEPIDIVSDDSSRSGNGWAWDSETKTLVLNGLDMDLSSVEDCIAGIVLPEGDINIVLQDTSRIRVAGTGVNGIYANGSLSILGADDSFLRIDAVDGAEGIEVGQALEISNTKIMSLGMHYGIHCKTFSMEYTELTAEAEGGIALRIDPTTEMLSAGPVFSVLDDPDNVTSSLDLYGERGALVIFGEADDDFLVVESTVMPPHLGDPDDLAHFQAVFDENLVYQAYSEYGLYIDGNGELVGAVQYLNLILLRARDIYMNIDDLTIHEKDANAPQLEASVFPRNSYDLSVTWHSEDPSVADIEDAGADEAGNALGNIVINGPGKTVITATANDDTIGNIVCACEITVTDAYLYVGDTAIKESGQITEGITYDEQTNTLTLDNASVDGKALGSHPVTIVNEGFRDYEGVEAYEGNALITYSLKAPLNIIVNGAVTFDAEGIEDGIGIAIEPFAAGELVLTGPVNITGADGASMTFNNCSFASIAGSDNYYAPEGSVDDKEVPNLSLQDITITDEGMGRYGILSGRGMDITNTAISVANKDILGIRTGNLMLMTDVDISVSNIGNIGIYASGGGYSMASGKLTVSNTGQLGLGAPSIGRITGGEVTITNSMMAMTGGQYFSMEDGCLTITDAEYGLFSSLTGNITGGTIRIDAEGYAMNTGRTAIGGGDIVLTSQNGFAFMAPGQGDRNTGFTMMGGTLEASSNGHAAFLAAYGANIWEPEDVLLPEGGRLLSEAPEDLGVEIFTIAGKDVEEIKIDYSVSAVGPQIIDIEGGAEHVRLGAVINEYEIVSGDGTSWEKGSSEGLEIVIKGSPADERTYDRFLDAFVDYARMDSDDYEIRSGSLVLTLEPSFLETLEDGEHFLKVVFTDDGSAETVFTVTSGGEEAPALTSSGENTPDDPEPSSGGSSKTGVWIGVCAAAAAVIAGTAVYSKKKKK